MSGTVNTGKGNTADKEGSAAVNAGLSGRQLFLQPSQLEVGRLTAGVASVTTASGSATGNPRNKHALQPGHSLMDWVRLGNSGKDLTGVGPQAGRLKITLKQLAEHDKRTDAWVAIRGNVYNITHYLNFHPGGVEELMRGAGKDATQLFDEVHAWVNYGSLLQKCLIGRLVSMAPEVSVEELMFGKAEKMPKPPTKQMAKVCSPIEDSKKLDNPANVVVTPLLPKFDWIQKSSDVTLIFYTKSYSNPHLEILPPSRDNTLKITLTYDLQIFINEIKLLHPVEWPCKTKLNLETGKVEICFKKTDTTTWPIYGMITQTMQEVSILETNLPNKYTVVNKQKVTYNTWLLDLQRCDDARIVLPLGKHLRVFGNIGDNELSRSYTPVPVSLFTKYSPQSFATDNVCLMVKSYENGNVSKHICSKNKGEGIETSKPLGSFHLDMLEKKHSFIIFAAGTGITPMLGIILFLLARRIHKCQRISLAFFNKTELDIPFRSHLHALQTQDERFQVDHVLSQADQDWRGRRGPITVSLVEQLVESHLDNVGSTKADLFVLVCGPTPFTHTTEELLVQVGLDKEQMFSFLG